MCKWFQTFLRLINFSRFLCEQYLKKELGLRRLLKPILEHVMNDVRKFVVFKINFHAEDFIDMINWTNITTQSLQ